MSRVFGLALLAGLNPVLLTATTVMLLLPRPKRLLLGYLLGAYTTSITVGLAIVFWLSDSGELSTTKHTVSPGIDIVLGALALLIAFVVGTGRMARRKERRRSEHADEPKKTPRWQQTLSKGSARDTFVVGILLSFPGASYLACLTNIAKLNLSNVAIVADGRRGRRRDAPAARAAAARLRRSPRPGRPPRSSGSKAGSPATAPTRR